VTGGSGAVGRNGSWAIQLHPLPRLQVRCEQEDLGLLSRPQKQRGGYWGIAWTLCGHCRHIEDDTKSSPICFLSGTPGHHAAVGWVFARVEGQQGERKRCLLRNRQVKLPRTHYTPCTKIGFVPGIQSAGTLHQVLSDHKQFRLRNTSPPCRGA